GRGVGSALPTDVRDETGDEGPFQPRVRSAVGRRSRIAAGALTSGRGPLRARHDPSPSGREDRAAWPRHRARYGSSATMIPSASASPPPRPACRAPCGPPSHGSPLSRRAARGSFARGSMERDERAAVWAFFTLRFAARPCFVVAMGYLLGVV